MARMEYLFYPEVINVINERTAVFQVFFILILEREIWLIILHKLL